MASTAEGGNLAHKMKRTGRALWKRNSFGVASASSLDDRTRSETGNTDNVSTQMVVSDIFSPTGGHQSGPLVETPVPLPVPMRTPTLTTSTTSTLLPPTANPKTLAANKDILQAQRDWEKKQALRENQGTTQEGQSGMPILRPQMNVDSTKASVQRELRDLFQASETNTMAALKRLPEETLLDQMAELNRPKSAGGTRRREPRAHAASSSASVSTSSSIRSSLSHSSDVMDTGDGESSRTGLLTNADNVSYYTYIEDDGSEQSTNNAPIPPGRERYDRGEQGGKLLFVCPVRDCRVLSVTMRALSSHFHGKHNRSLFNDNGDGTFSRVGDYMNEEGSSPGIIISCNPIPPGAPPPAVPDCSESQKKLLLGRKSPSMPRAGVLGSVFDSKRSLRRDASSEAVDDRLPKRPKTTPVPLPFQPASIPSPPPMMRQIPPPAPPTLEALGPPMTDVLRYLHRSLSPSQQVPARPDIVALSQYKQVRSLPGLWWEHHHDKTLDPLQYSCILAYLVGKTEEMNPCRRWKGLSRLGDPCVGLPPDLPAEARAAFSKTVTCIACQYQFCCYRVKNECEWASKDHDPYGTMEEAVTQRNHQSFKQNDKVAVLEGEGVSGSAATKVDDHAALTRVTRQSNGLFSSLADQHPIQDSGETSSPLATTALQTSITVQRPSPAEVMEMEEMEDWEVAPGTMKDELTNTNIGFSNAYMSNQHPITISPGISFNVLILKPGHRHHWPAEANKVRSCSVASGKVSVKMGNGQAFKLGSNGVVVIRPGQSCMIANRLYSDAILHCTTIEDDFQ